MLLWIWTRDDETGLLDDEFRDGDVMQSKPDAFEPSIGTQEKKSWLIVKIPDPPNPTKVADELERAEYTLGSSPEESVVRRKRIFRVPWRDRFTAAEITVIEDANAMLPDGPLTGSGSVTSGVVSDKFTIADLRRK